uniref:Integrase catalytic domain-containing protein n=1 Tax=Tanacetum cinerariifolium TaxID=118510 RepID=A0A699K631_TANCI|nr:hypothetical protein [Tanacetum cinerariifolium]
MGSKCPFTSSVVHYRAQKSIDEKEVLAVVEEEERTWMTPIHEYIVKEILPEEKKKARAVRRKANRKSLKIRVLLANYGRECQETNKECNDCQVYRLVLRNPQQNLAPITSLWPFYKWRIDIAGPFPEVPSKVKFLIAAIGYLTKWIEAKPVATITGAQIKKFVCDNIVCRFGFPGEIISDNGKQFMDNPFKDCFGNQLRHSGRKREREAIQEVKSKAKREKYYNLRVRNTSFRPGDFVYQNNKASYAEEGGVGNKMLKAFPLPVMSSHCQKTFPLLVKKDFIVERPKDNPQDTTMEDEESLPDP